MAYETPGVPVGSGAGRPGPGDMISEQRTTVIDRPVTDVFSYVTNGSRYPEWSTGVQEASLTSDPPLRGGSTIPETVRLLGWQFDTEMVVNGTGGQPPLRP